MDISLRKCRAGRFRWGANKTGALAVLLLACASAGQGIDSNWMQTERLGDAFTVYSFGQSPYVHAATVLSLEDRRAFSEGARAFRREQSTNVASFEPQHRNAATCVSCHFANGRGRAHSESFAKTGFSISTSSAETPVYRTLGFFDPSVAILEGVVWRKVKESMLADGTIVDLVVPVSIINGEEKRAPIRNAPAVFGLGLLEAIPEHALRTLAEEKPFANAGIKGRLAVADIGGGVGRFGWKGSFGSLEAQVENAIVGELGVSHQGSGSIPITSGQLTSYMRGLAVPARRLDFQGEFRRGAMIFEGVGCAMCHMPKWKTGIDKTVRREYRGLDIYPFTDLLLHDMGPGLADSGDQESGRMWRTAPLWGIGLQKIISGQTGFLHDGRARDLVEAVLWHGGEAADSSRRFQDLSTRDREELLKFLSSL